MNRSTLQNPWSDDVLAVADCDWRGCDRRAEYVVAFGAHDHEADVQMTMERRPLCTRHADACSAAWHTAVYVSSASVTRRYRVVPYDD